MKFSNVGSYKGFKYVCVFCLSIRNFWNIERPPTILISRCFKMLVLGVWKLRSTYILHPHWCFYSFQPFMGFSFEGMYWDRYLFCFIRIFWDFTVRNHDVLLDYMGTPWRNFTLQIFMIKILICLYIIARNNATCYFLWLWCVPEKKIVSDKHWKSMLDDITVRS